MKIFGVSIGVIAVVVLAFVLGMKNPNFMHMMKMK